MRMLENKVAVVLGCSAEAGTGWGVAEGLAKAGAKVIVAARREPELQKLASKINGAAVVCDAAKQADIVHLADYAKREFGSIDVAVNAAALGVSSKVRDFELADLQQALDVNYLANAVFVKHMAANMNDGGSIVLFSSSSTVQPFGDVFPYACAKAATDCLVKYAALEYGGRGIRVNSIVAGAIKSEWTAELFADKAIEDTFCTEIPLGRVGLPSDYADVVLWLSGPAFVTGLNLPVSGGNQLTRSPRMDELFPPADTQN